MPAFGDMREWHAVTAECLLEMIDGLIAVIQADEVLGEVLRLVAIETLRSARIDLYRCTYRVEDQIKRIEDLYLPTHGNLIMWITFLNIDLKLLDPDIEDMVADRLKQPITETRLNEGKALVAELANCRTPLKFT